MLTGTSACFFAGVAAGAVSTAEEVAGCSLVAGIAAGGADSLLVTGIATGLAGSLLVTEIGSVVDISCRMLRILPPKLAIRRISWFIRR